MNTSLRVPMLAALFFLLPGIAPAQSAPPAPVPVLLPLEVPAMPPPEASLQPPIAPPGPPPIPPPDQIEPGPSPVFPPKAAPAGPKPDDPLALGMGTFFGVDSLTGFRQSFALFGAGWMPNEPLSGQSGHLGMTKEGVAVATPMWNDNVNSVSIFASMQGENFFTNAILPNSGREFPDDLWAVHVGGTYSHHFDNGWSAGGTLSVGSASDELFHSTREMDVGGNAFLVIPQGEHNAWLFTITYSPTAELDFPIPGVAFVWQPSDDFRMLIGLPFLIMYRPVDQVTLDFSYVLVRNVHARATYHVTPRLGVYCGYDWSNESFFLADREDYNDRFFSYNQRISTGVQAKITSNFMLELSAGYVFDRFYFQGSSYSDRYNDRVDVDSGVFVGLQGRVRW
jgi:hypothetical protein